MVGEAQIFFIRSNIFQFKETGSKKEKYVIYNLKYFYYKLLQVNQTCNVLIDLMVLFWCKIYTCFAFINLSVCGFIVETHKSNLFSSDR
jgi:hypothetical protein